jgi:hypothetical protein
MVEPTEQVLLFGGSCRRLLASHDDASKRSRSILKRLLASHWRFGWDAPEVLIMFPGASVNIYIIYILPHFCNIAQISAILRIRSSGGDVLRRMKGSEGDRKRRNAEVVRDISSAQLGRTPETDLMVSRDSYATQRRIEDGRTLQNCDGGFISFSSLYYLPQFFPSRTELLSNTYWNLHDSILHDN